jgi:hypothetical protein
MKRIYAFVFLTLGVLWISSCKKDEPGSTAPETLIPQTADLNSNIATRWFDLSLQLTKGTPGFSPPVAARTFGYLGLTLYESCVNGMPGYKSLQGKITSFSDGAMPAKPFAEIHYGIAANRAMSVAMFALYKAATTENIQKIFDLERTILQELSKGLDEQLIGASVDYGDAVGNAVFQFALTDGQEWAVTRNFPAGYSRPTFPGAWKPTPPAMQPVPLQPYWGNVRPFLTQNIKETQPPAPPAYSLDVNSEFYKQSNEVYTTVKNISPEQKVIAEFWSDDPGKTATPPGHSIAILTQVLSDRKANLAMAAISYVRMGMAQHDAFVSCWKCKYDYNLLRPVTYINENIDPAWKTILNTPPFPEYTSGHSVQSAAMAEVMTGLFGDNYTFTDRTHEARTDIDGKPRTFKSFRAAAAEAALSRLYGGIHYRFGIDAGLGMGEKIGKNIMDIDFKK